jgi:hypothetical protein
MARRQSFLWTGFFLLVFGASQALAATCQLVSKNVLVQTYTLNVNGSTALETVLPESGTSTLTRVSFKTLLNVSKSAPTLAQGSAAQTLTVTLEQKVGKIWQTVAQKTQSGSILVDWLGSHPRNGTISLDWSFDGLSSNAGDFRLSFSSSASASNKVDLQQAWALNLQFDYQACKTPLPAATLCLWQPQYAGFVLAPLDPHNSSSFDSFIPVSTATQVSAYSFQAQMWVHKTGPTLHKGSAFVFATAELQSNDGSGWVSRGSQAQSASATVEWLGLNAAWQHLDLNFNFSPLSFNPAKAWRVILTTKTGTSSKVVIESYGLASHSATYSLCRLPPTFTPSPTATPTRTLTRTFSASPTRTASPSATPTRSATPTPSATASATASRTATPTPSVTPLYVCQSTDVVANNLNGPISFDYSYSFSGMDREHAVHSMQVMLRFRGYNSTATLPATLNLQIRALGGYGPGPYPMLAWQNVAFSLSAGTRGYNEDKQTFSFNFEPPLGYDGWDYQNSQIDYRIPPGWNNVGLDLIWVAVNRCDRGTVTITPSRTPSSSPSATPSGSPSATSSPSASATSSATASPTATGTATATAMDSPSATGTPSLTGSPSPTDLATASPTATATPSASATPTVSETALVTPDLAALPCALAGQRSLVTPSENVNVVAVDPVSGETVIWYTQNSDFERYDAQGNLLQHAQYFPGYTGTYGIRDLAFDTDGSWLAMGAGGTAFRLRAGSPSSIDLPGLSGGLRLGVDAGGGVYTLEQNGSNVTLRRFERSGPEAWTPSWTWTQDYSLLGLRWDLAVTQDGRAHLHGYDNSTGRYTVYRFSPGSASPELLDLIPADYFMQSLSVDAAGDYVLSGTNGSSTLPRYSTLQYNGVSGLAERRSDWDFGIAAWFYSPMARFVPPAAYVVYGSPNPVLRFDLCAGAPAAAPAAARLDGKTTPAPLPQTAKLVIAPNPFAGMGLLQVSLPRAARARVSILDLTGTRVWAQDLGSQSAGIQPLGLDLRGKADGIYIAVLETDSGEGWKPAARFKLALAR